MKKITKCPYLIRIAEERIPLQCLVDKYDEKLNLYVPKDVSVDQVFDCFNKFGSCEKYQNKQKEDEKVLKNRMKKNGLETMLEFLEKDSEERLTWDEYFMSIAETVALRGTCDRGKTGAVIAKDKRILSTGYVGAPTNLKHCDEVGHLIKRKIHEDERISYHCERTTHAEINAIALAAKNGTSIEGSTIYCKLEPCFTCAKAIINSGIKRVVTKRRYHDGYDTRRIFKQANIELKVIFDEIEKYSNQ